MTFANNTPFQALDIPLLHPNGSMVVVAVLKAAFRVLPNHEVVPEEAHPPVRVNDELYDPEAPESSIRLPTDVCVQKVGTDVIVVGDAISPRPVKMMDLSVKVRERLVPLRVWGPRVFFRRVVGVEISDPVPFERQPIVYEKAYGGVTEDGWLEEKRNRSGVGIASSSADLIDKIAPQIEHPDRPHQTADDHHPPVGYGAIRSHWSPRRERFGTFDETWEKTRMPIMPKDFDMRAHNCAHPDLHFEDHLRPGDVVGVSGMSEDGSLAFALPNVVPRFISISDETGRREQEALPDTIIVQPAERRFEVTWRAAVPQGRGKDVLRELRVELSPS